MTTDDVFGSGVQLNELLDISSGDTFTSLGNAILDDFMFGDLSGAEGLKLICDVSESIKRELDILIVISLEAVEEVAKDTDSLISLG